MDAALVSRPYNVSRRSRGQIASKGTEAIVEPQVRRNKLLSLTIISNKPIRSLGWKNDELMLEAERIKRLYGDQDKSTRIIGSTIFHQFNQSIAVKTKHRLLHYLLMEWSTKLFTGGLRTGRSPWAKLRGRSRCSSIIIKHHYCTNPQTHHPSSQTHKSCWHVASTW